MMKNINSKQQISDANASGRGLSSAPQNINCNTSFNSKKVSQNGRSMIEMLGVLAIIGVLSVGGIAGYSKAMQKYRINKTIEQITLIAGNIRAFFAPQGNYVGADCGCYDGSCSGLSSGDGCPIIKKAKILPDEMIIVNADGEITAITSAFGTTVSLSNTDGYGGVRLDYNDIPQESCIELLSQDWRNANIAFMGQIPQYLLIPPAELNDVITVCDNEYNGTVSLSFFFDADYTLDSELRIINE